MSKRIKFKGRLKTYMNLTLFLGILLAILTILTYFYDYRVGIVMTIFMIFYFTAQIVLICYNRPIIVNELISFATEYGQVQKQVLKELQLPHALLDENGKVIWFNNEFERITNVSKGYHRSITNIFPSITTDKIPGEENETSMEIAFEESFYLAKMKKIVVSDMIRNSDLVDAEEYEGFIVGLYLFDQTAVKIALKEIDDQSMAVGMIYLDNYEEAFEGVEEYLRSIYLAIIDSKINKTIASVDGIVKKLEKDKYIIVLRKKSVAQLRESRFSALLSDLKRDNEDKGNININMGKSSAPDVTLSIGIGLDGLSFSQNYEFARTSIDLALGRGGDQVVIKTPSGVSYYGANTQQVEKSTRVKARVKAQALVEIIQSREKVFIMGHRLADVDSFGAAIGVYCIAKAQEKKAHIILNDISSSMKPLVELFTVNDEYEDDMIINSQQALEMVGTNSVLVVVDNNKPSITECPDMIKHCKSIVVLDHHRQGTDTIDNATLSYVEPNASSACEMVAEILQYVQKITKLKGIEADCLYSGIMIDTNNFMTKTGVRTFEAAAFLRRAGADVTRVRKLFREDAADYMVKAKAVRDAAIYRDYYAISVCDSEATSPTIIAAQAANELLNINGIRASFVFTDYQGVIYLSARSIDENVQIILEKLGGGGHMTIAGAQFKDMSMDEAIKQLKAVLDEMLSDGEMKQ